MTRKQRIRIEALLDRQLEWIASAIAFLDDIDGDTDLEEEYDAEEQHDIEEAYCEPWLSGLGRSIVPAKRIRRAA